MFLFYFESSFDSRDTEKFILTSWTSKKNSFVTKIKLISKFIMSQPGKQTIAIDILPNMSRSKGNQTMKSDQLINRI